MKSVYVALILLTSVGSYAHAQNAGISDESLQALQRAVVNIAIRNNAVENLIYDGMTVRDVEAILQQRVALSVEFIVNEVYHVSAHGNYLVLWSGAAYTNPVVVGFVRRGETRIRHNYVDSVEPAGPKESR